MPHLCTAMATPSWGLNHALIVRRAWHSLQVDCGNLLFLHAERREVSTRASSVRKEGFRGPAYGLCHMGWSHCRRWSGTATDHVSARETLHGHSSLRFWRHDTAGRTWEGPHIRQPSDRRRAQLQTQAWTWCRRTNLVTPCRRGCIHWSAHRGSRWRWPEILALQWRGVRHC